MAAINVVLNGTFTSDAGTQVGTFIGTMAYSDRGVGGGPIYPGGPGGQPHPEHPIVIPPGKPDVPPPSIWPPGPGIDFPAHPIVLPDPGNPIPPGTVIDWEAVWSPEDGWQVVGYPQVPHPAPG